MNLKRTFLDDRARPNAADDLVLGDQLAGRLRQNLDDFECAASQRDRNSLRPQFTPRAVHLPPSRIQIRLSTLRQHAVTPLFPTAISRSFLNYPKEWMRPIRRG